MIRRIEINDYSYNINGKIIKFPEKVYEAILMDDKIIVEFNWARLKQSFPNSEYWRGVWCYDFKGNVLWQVEDPYSINPNTGKKNIHTDGEGAIDRVGYSEKENKIIVYGRVGYEVDPETGKLGDIIWHER